MNNDGHSWIFKFIIIKSHRFFWFQVEACNVVLTNNYCTFTILLLIVVNVKIKPSDGTVLLLSNLDDYVCPTVDLFDTLHFSYIPRTHTQPLVPTNVHKIPCSPLCMRLTRHGPHFPCPSLHPSSSSLGLKIVNALKLIKYKRRSKFDLTTIDFDSIDVLDVKYLPPSFDGDILFVLPLVSMNVPNVYSHSTDGIDKMYDGHP